jgi:electron transport complex protein RnfG
MFEFLGSFWRQSWLVLVLAAVLGASLAGVDSSLRSRIDQHSRERIERALLEVVPGGVASRPRSIAGRQVFSVHDDAGRLRGWAIPAEGRGFQDRIRVLVGLSPNADAVIGLTILDSHETPGLGDRIQQPDFRRQFIGRSTADPFVRVKPGASAASPIHAVTGATISSQAVIDAVNEQIAAVRQELASIASGPEERTP